MITRLTRRVESLVGASKLLRHFRIENPYSLLDEDGLPPSEHMPGTALH